MEIDFILESFNLDPIKLTDELYEFSIFHENTKQEFGNIITETANGATKKNIFQKIWNFIKKVFGLMRIGIAKIISFIESLFTKKKRSVDQIARELNIQTSSESFSNSKGSSQVKINSNPNSEVKMPEFISSVFKPIIIKINEDDSITLTISEIQDTQKKIRSAGNAPTHGYVRNSDVANALALMTTPDQMDDLVMVATIMTKSIKTNPIKFWESWEIWKIKFDKVLVASETKVSLKEMRYFQIKLNEINKMLEMVDTPDNSIPIDEKDFLKGLNQFASFAAQLQMGMNTVSGALQSIYTIDAKYNDTIGDINTLSSFIDKCIKYAIPPKYVSYNAYLISNPSLKGDGSEGNENSPRWGQTRVVFFPKNNKKVIHKIALSGFGIRANKSEYDISEKFINNGGQNLIAAVVSTTPSLAIISAERVNISKGNNLYDDIKRLRNKLFEFTQKNDIALDIRGDIHEDNVGYKNGKCVAIDYGNNKRIMM